jgi:hypothetical protein
MPLKDVMVRKAKATSRPQKLSDGGGLHVLIQPTGSKLWRLAYRFAGKQKTLAQGLIRLYRLKRLGGRGTRRRNFWLDPWILRCSAKQKSTQARRAPFVPSLRR